MFSVLCTIPKINHYNFTDTIYMNPGLSYHLDNINDNLNIDVIIEKTLYLKNPIKIDLLKYDFIDYKIKNYYNYDKMILYEYYEKILNIQINYNEKINTTELINNIDEQIRKSIIIIYESKEPINKIKKYKLLNTTYYGIELEIELHDYKYLSLIDYSKLNNWILKEDGSLINGIEFVSIPLIYSELVNEINVLLTELNKINDYIIFNNHTGLHINISNNDISLNDLYCILFDILKKNKRYWIKLANRRETEYTLYGNNFKYERNSAINIMNEEYIEFRIFKSTLDNYTIVNYIDEIDKLIERCKINDIIYKSEIRIPSKYKDISKFNFI